jgi:hypothetical protein
MLVYIKGTYILGYRVQQVLRQAGSYLGHNEL